MISLILRRQGGKTLKRTYLAKWMKLQCQTNEFLTFNILFHQIFLSHPPLFHTLFSPTHFHSVSCLFFLSVSLHTFYYFSFSTSFYLSISFYIFLSFPLHLYLYLYFLCIILSFPLFSTLSLILFLSISFIFSSISISLSFSLSFSFFFSFSLSLSRFISPSQLLRGKYRSCILASRRHLFKYLFHLFIAVGAGGFLKLCN